MPDPAKDHTDHPTLVELLQRGRMARAVPGRLGRHEVLVETAQLGGRVGTSVYQIRGNRVLTFRAMNGYREDVTTALLDAVDDIVDADDLGHRVHLRPIDVPGFALDRVALLGPGATEFFRGKPHLADRAVEIVPMHRSEVVDGEGSADFWFAASRRGTGIDRYDWARAPRPKAMMRLLDAWPGGQFRRTEKLFPVAAQRVLDGVVPELPAGVRLLILDVRGHELELRREWDRVCGTLRPPGSATSTEITVPRHMVWDAVGALFRGDATEADSATPRIPTRSSAEPGLLELTYSSHDRGFAELPIPVPREQCVARLRKLTAHPGNFMTFGGRSGGVVQVVWEEGPRLWLETPVPSEQRSVGRHVSLDEAQKMVELLADEDRVAVAELRHLETRHWPER